MQPRVRDTGYRVNNDKKIFAKGDVVTSPFANGNDFTSPVLFASNTNVTPRVGSVMTIDDEPFSTALPNCQMTGSPL